MELEAVGWRAAKPGYRKSEAENVAAQSPPGGRVHAESKVVGMIQNQAAKRQQNDNSRERAKRTTGNYPMASAVVP